MSNSSSSPVVLRIQQSALVFVVLILALGALILAANNIDPNAVVRGDVKYTLWNSPDGLVSLEYPAGWSPVPNNTPLQYIFAPNDQSAGGELAFAPVSAYGIDVTDADKDPQGVFDKIAAKQAPGAPITSRPVTVDGLSGVAGLLETSNTDPSTGASQNSSMEVWIVPLDGTHLFLTNISATTETMTAIRPLWEHMMSTLRINNTAALLALGVGTPAPTAAPTLAATAGATDQATADATSAATTAVTTAATSVATP